MSLPWQPNSQRHNVSAEPDAIETALQQHNLAALFIEHFRWESLLKCNVELTPLLKKQAQCIPIAMQKNTAVWKVKLAIGTDLTSALKEQLYGEIVGISRFENRTLANARNETSSFPLVIFVDEQDSRSLWCQTSSSQNATSQNTETRAIESALYISGQPIALWKFRLNRLRKKEQELFRSYSEQTYQSFRSLLDDLCEGIVEIGNMSDRQNYAALTLQRLTLLQAIQQKGWMNDDRWYLQTRFGEALQTKKNFFRDCLQPLYHCLALPEVERPTAVSAQIGTVPFLGHLFHTHRLEQRYPTLSIKNLPFEQILGWLSEQTSADNLNLWSSGDLSYCLEQSLASQSNAERMEQATVSNSVGLAKTISDRTLSQLLISRTQAISKSNSTDANDLLFNADAKICRYLIQDMLPNLRILDPACGSGNLLIAIYQQLTEVFSNLIGYSEQNRDAQLKIWQAGLAEDSEQDEQYAPRETLRSPANLLQTVQRRILKNILHGVDISMQAVENTIFQLLLHTVSTAQQQQDIEPLVDLSFNILVGNSLIGLVDVDKERFETIQKADNREIVQGNLLQPLVADSYQTILAEKNLAVEHYKYRNQMLADARNIPDYARAALLKEDILRLDINAQQKLDELLLNQMSQQLGIQYKAAQLVEKPQRRPLTLEDIDILQPFHWGYHFNTILEKGGFDIVVCDPPVGAFKPTTAGFFQKFRDLADVKGVSVRSLKTSKQALAKGDPEIAQAWLFYQDQYAYVADYFYRSEQYAHQNPTVEGKTIRNQLSRERLFVEQCFNLTSNRGLYAIVLSKKLSAQPKAQTLEDFLKAKARLTELESRETSTEAAMIMICEKRPETPS